MANVRVSSQHHDKHGVPTRNQWMPLLMMAFALAAAILMTLGFFVAQP